MFDYLNKKIHKAKFRNEPFEHIYIENFLSDEHFKEITSSNELGIEAHSTKDLFTKLKEKKFHPISFPGCTSSENEYLNWEKKNQTTYQKSETCESFGMVFRLDEAKNQTLKALSNFVEKGGFFEALSEKFQIVDSVKRDHGIQKYMNGYEISPHPDTRRKALTFMLNLNPGIRLDKENVHTKYCKFKPQHEFIYNFWEKNTNLDRSWLPWDWVNVESIQEKNNSIVIFSPSAFSLHAVKLEYDHCVSQRTQLYGNLWYNDFLPIPVPSYKDFDIQSRVTKPRKSFLKRFLTQNGRSN